MKNQKRYVALALASVLGLTSAWGGEKIALPKNASVTSEVLAASGVTTSDFDSAIGSGGSITLAENIIHSGVITISQNVEIDLDGHTLDTSDGSSLAVDGGKLTLRDGTVDCSINVKDGSLKLEDGNYKDITVEADGILEMEDGTISNAGWGVEINGGQFTMNGGEITDNNDGGVQIDGSGSFIMNDGSSVSGNRGWGGIYIKDGSFTMKGGSVDNNHGEGVEIYDGKFIMENGTINGNTAWGVMIHPKGTFNMSNGNINENGGGVSVLGEFELSGGNIRSNQGHNLGGVHIIDDGIFKISKNPVIAGNTDDDNNLMNVFLDDETKMVIDGKLTDGFKAGVYTFGRTGDFTKGYKDNNSSDDPTKFFTSDDSNYSVSLNSATGEASLIQAATTSPASGSSQRTATSSNNSSNSSRNNSSSGDSGSTAISFSNGGARTSGSGESKADYTKAGKSSVTYQMSEISYKATSAKVPATTKIGKKTYKVTSIAPGAFVSYTKLKEVTIGKNIKRIGSGAFDGCKNLKTLVVNSKKLTAKKIKGALKGSSVTTVYVPADKVKAYKKIFTKTIVGKKVSVKAKK